MRGINGMNLTRMRFRLGMVSSFARPGGRDNLGGRRIIQSRPAIVNSFEPKRLDRPNNISLSDLGIDEAAAWLSGIKSAKAADFLRNEDLGGKLTAEILNRIALDKREEIMDEMDLDLNETTREHLNRFAVDEMDIEEVEDTLIARGKLINREVYKYPDDWRRDNLRNRLLSVLHADQNDSFSRLHVEMEEIDKQGGKSESKIFAEMEPREAAGILYGSSFGRRLEILGCMDTLEAGKILTVMQPRDAAEILCTIGNDKAKEIIRKMKTTAAAEILDRTESANASELLSHEGMTNQTKAEILANINPSRAAEILLIVDSYDKQNILNEMHPIEQIKILGEKEPKAAVEVLLNNYPTASEQIAIIIDAKVRIPVVSNILSALSPNRAISILEGFSASSDVAILTKMSISKAVSILDLLSRKNLMLACSILNNENLSDEKVMELLSRAQRQAELFNELNANRMVRIAQMSFVPKGE